MVKCFRVAAILLGIVSFPATASAQLTEPSWLEPLRLQLVVDQECEAQYFLNIRERHGAAENTYSARVQCADGRQFDASRTDPAMDFTIEICGQAVCGLQSPGTNKS